MGWLKAFVDLDGTILSVEERCGRLFSELVGLDYADFGTRYIALRRQGLTNSEILSNSQDGFCISHDDFRRRWMERIETESFLKYDRLVEGVVPWLQSHSGDWGIILCTDRQSSEKASGQLADFGLRNFFQEILVTEQKVSKAELVRLRGIELSGDDWFVGDSPGDILAGKTLGLRTCAVLSGLSGRESLERLQPDLVVSSIDHFCPSLSEK